MKTIRRLVYFVVGLLIGTTAVLSFAETMSATYGSYTATSFQGSSFNGGPLTPIMGSMSAVADYSCSSRGGTQSYWYDANAGHWWYNCKNYASSVKDQLGPVCTGGGTLINVQAMTCVGYSCPASGGWTLQGQTCVRPDCAPGESRDPNTGQCISQCPMYNGSDVPSLTDKPANCECPSGTEWFFGGGCRKTCGSITPGSGAWGDPMLFYPDGSSMGCYGGCEVQPNSDDYLRANGGRYFYHSTYGKWACSGNGDGTKPTPDGQPEKNNPEKPDGDPHEPKCNGENVVTRSDGTVVCMPAGTPNSNKPKTEEVKKSEQYSDGSSKETTTHTTTDPGTGAKYYITTTIITPATGGGAGSAGTPGTSTSTTKGGTTGTGSGAGKDGGECDPTSQFCGGPEGELWQGKEKTFDQVLNKFRAGFSATPVVSASAAFFAVSVPNGSCPSWQVVVPVVDVTLNLSQYFCTTEAIQMMDLVGAVLLALVFFVAFRWAIL